MPQLLAAHADRETVRAAFARLFERADVLLTPAVPLAPPRIEDERADPALREAVLAYTAPQDLVGLPASCCRTACSSPDRRARRRCWWPSHPRSQRSRLRAKSRRVQGKLRAALIGGSHYEGSEYLALAAGLRGFRAVARVRRERRAPTATSCSTRAMRSRRRRKADVQQAGGTFVGCLRQDRRRDRALGQRRVRAASCGKDNRVEGVSSTARFASKLQEPSGGDAEAAAGPQPGELPNAPATDSDSSVAVPVGHAADPHAAGARDHGRQPVGRGRRHRHRASTTRHPDLRAERLRRRQRRTASSGVADPGRGGRRRRQRPRHAHRRHDRGGVATASASSAWRRMCRVAGIKAGNADGFFFPEAVVCAFMWAGDRTARRDQQLVLRRSVASTTAATTRSSARSGRPSSGRSSYAQSQGVTVVASAGNVSDDLSHPTRDVDEPRQPARAPPQEREIHEQLRRRPGRGLRASSACRPPAAPRRTRARASTGTT